MYSLSATVIFILFILAPRTMFNNNFTLPVLMQLTGVLVAERLVWIQQNYGKGYVSMDTAGCKTLVQIAIRAQNLEAFNFLGRSAA